jgi:hypothetical protein
MGGDGSGLPGFREPVFFVKCCFGLFGVRLGLFWGCLGCVSEWVLKVGVWCRWRFF